MFEGSKEEMAQQAERLLSSIAPGSFCTAQEWADRIDCGIHLPDGSFIAEMIPLADLSEARVREAGERFKKRAEGQSVTLMDELPPPIRIFPAGDKS